MKTRLAVGEPFIIPAGQFAFLLSMEEINVPPDGMAFISMRTGVKFQGLTESNGPSCPTIITDLRTKVELTATILLPNSVARVGID
jgi:hypothetical protein